MLGPVIHAFGDCELDTERFELRRAGSPQHVEPQVFDVLRYLIEHRDRVVSREELLQQVWGHTYVSDATLSSRLMAARKAIGDSGRAQGLIRTVRGRGYRFVGELVRAQEPIATTGLPSVLGRDGELERLRAELGRAREGERRTVFITGEPGIGKTALVNAFVEPLAAGGEPDVLVARGFCLEYRGAGEAYMPVLEALGRLAGSADGADLLAVLGTRAPTWLLQMPWLVEPDRLDHLRGIGMGATSERMLRELAEALETFTARRLLVLALEDVHWSDASTLDLVSRLARRPEQARLLLVCTCRPGVEASDALRRELRGRGHGSEIVLPLLSEGVVTAKIADRLGGSVDPGLAAAVEARSGGNPLFIECLVDGWLERGVLAQANGDWTLDAGAASLPATLTDVIEDDLGRLPAADLAALEAASVVGREFAADAVPADHAEERCAALAARGRVLVRIPDPLDRSLRFSFVHDLHREVLYERITPSRRAALHRAVAGRLEARYAGEAERHAAEIALHLVAGRAPKEAVPHLLQAAEQALARSGHREALAHLQAASEQLRVAGPFDGAAMLEMDVNDLLAPALIASEGFASPRAEAALRRVLEVSEQLGDVRRTRSTLFRLAALREFGGNYPATEQLLKRSLALAPEADDEGDAMHVHELLACSLFHQGEFARSVEHAELGLALARTGREPDAVAASLGEDALVSCHAWAAASLGCLGEFERAEAAAQAAIDAADTPSRLHGLGHALIYSARLHQLSGDRQAVEREARQALDLATARGFGYQGAVARMLLGWALAVPGEDAALELIRRGLDEHEATGAEMDRPYFLALHAEAALACGRFEEARASLTDALARISGGRGFFYAPEIHRLWGELELAEGGGPEAAEPHFGASLALARRAGARALELRTDASRRRAS